MNSIIKETKWVFAAVAHGGPPPGHAGMLRRCQSDHFSRPSILATSMAVASHSEAACLPLRIGHSKGGGLSLRLCFDPRAPVWSHNAGYNALPSIRRLRLEGFLACPPRRRN